MFTENFRALGSENYPQRLRHMIIYTLNTNILPFNLLHTGKIPAKCVKLISSKATMYSYTVVSCSNNTCL